MSTTQKIFFNRTITKDLTATDSQRRLFEGILTVEMVDKQNEVTIVDELMKALPIWMARGAPISDTHSNRIVGRGVTFQKTTVTDADGTIYPAITIQGEIFKDYDLDNEIWDKIKSGEYKGLSFGGATRSDRIPITNKDGTTSYALHDLEHYEVAVCEDPAVPLALITQSNQIAKAISKGRAIGIPKYEDLGLGRICIKCSDWGCHVEKESQIEKYGVGSSGSSSPSIASDPTAEALKDPQEGKQEFSTTGGVNKPTKEEAQLRANHVNPSGGHEGHIPNAMGESTPRSGGGLDLSGLGKNDEKKYHDEDDDEDEEDKEKTINPGENLLTEKPIRGIRGTGGERAFDPITGKSDTEKAYLNREKEEKAVNQGGQYDMNGIDRVGDDLDPRSETEKDPRAPTEKDGATPPTISGSNSEDGVNGKLRTNDDPPADALKVEGGSNVGFFQDMQGTSQAIGDVGTKGSYDTFEQDTGDSRQANARNVKRIDAGMTDAGLASSDKADDLESVKMRLKLLSLKSI